MLELPFFQRIEQSKTILLAGAGGGFDIYCGLPLFFALRSAGRKVYLANLSFASISSVQEERLSPTLLKVTGDSKHSIDYFPEFFLTLWFKERRGEEVPIYCFPQSGVQPLLRDYRILVRDLGIDTVILVDGGTDSLMRGDEVGLGTPHEDVASIAALHQLDVPNKLLVCLGFGIDFFHGVCHSHFLEATADLTRNDGFLGLFSLTKDMPEVELYRDAVKFVARKMPAQNSIVAESILSAIDGNFGDHHASARTAGSELWINPLMAAYWCFNLEQVARRLLYLESIQATEEYRELEAAISAFRKNCGTVRPWRNIPV
jgi:hypothetical protein